MPRILLQQGTNLVNKFALLLHKCRFAQDSRDKPENDGSSRCWLSICCSFFNHPSPDTTVSTDKPSKGLDVVRQYAALLERRVQSSTRVRKAQVVTRQTKHMRNLLPQCASDATGFLSDVYKKSTRARKFLADGVQCGRSMIEMLGVLAIIAVLSVGGIAGYSKAMETYKLNRLVEQYVYLFRGLIEYRDSLVVTSTESYYLIETVSALGLISPLWNVNYAMCVDEADNKFNLTSRHNELVMDLNLKPGSEFSSKACEKLIQQVFQPLHAFISRIHFYDSSGKNHQFYYFGDTLCKAYNVDCLNNLPVTKIKDMCGYCSIKEDSDCFLVIYF